MSKPLPPGKHIVIDTQPRIQVSLKSMQKIQMFYTPECKSDEDDEILGIVSAKIGWCKIC